MTICRLDRTLSSATLVRWPRRSKQVQVLSFLILLITSTGIFMPLEVALNRVWRFPKNRSYLGNQVISLGLAFACGILALISIALSAGNAVLLRELAFGHDFFLVRALGFLTAKVFATATSMAIFFLVYWLLPNGKVPAKAVLPTAVIMGLLSEILKYSYILALPRLNFQEIYGPFALSVSMMFWAFLSGLLLLTGARLFSAEDLPQRVVTFNHHASDVHSSQAATEFEA